MRNFAEKGRAFTLIELLVVMTILSILLALLLPVMQGAKDAAINVVCMNNQKNIGMALGMYADDFDAYYPCRYSLSAQNLPNLTWHGYIYKYLDVVVKDPNPYWWHSHEKIFFCPAKTTGYAFDEWGCISYGMTWFNDEPYNYYHYKTTKFGNKTIIIGESIDKASIFRGERLRNRHPGKKTNILLWDLHVKNLTWMPTEMSWSSAAPKFDINGALSNASSFAAAEKSWLLNEYSP